MSKADKDAALFGLTFFALLIVGFWTVVWMSESDNRACAASGGDRVIDRQCVKLVPVPVLESRHEQ